MPAGKGRYTVGSKGSNGCSGYPVVGGEGKVHGCHKTRAEAEAQQAAIYASQNAESKKLWAGSAFGKADEISEVIGTPAGMKQPTQCSADSHDCGEESCKMCKPKR